MGVVGYSERAHSPARGGLLALSCLLDAGTHERTAGRPNEWRSDRQTCWCLAACPRPAQTLPGNPRATFANSVT
jgi:hypothetical protein